MADAEKTTQTSNFTPKIALGIAAHPDDLDFIAGGSVAAWTEAGATVYYLVLTNGNKGSADRNTDPVSLVQLRRNEQLAAAGMLGVKKVYFCNYEDGTLEVTMDVKRDIARFIRKLQPDTVFTLDPGTLYCAETGFINHPDHRAAGQAALDAIYPLARDYLSLPELYIGEGLEPHNVATVLLSNFSMDCTKHTFWIDVSDTIDAKVEARLAHKSQVDDAAAISEQIRSLASEEGKKVGCRYAEGFIRIDIK